jgi:hypothetical protein
MEDEQPVEQQPVEAPAAPQDQLGIGPEPQQDTFDDYNEFVEAKIDYAVKKSNAQAALRGEGNAPRPPFPQNKELRERMEKEAKERGEWGDILLLGEQGLDEHPIWNQEYAQVDYADKLNKFNENNEQGIFILPKEEEEWGATKAIKPSDTVYVEVPPKVAEEVRRAVYQGQGGFSRGNKFEAMWAELRRLGYAPEAKPTFGPRSAGPAKSQKDLYQSQRAFEAARKKQRARPW